MLEQVKQGGEQQGAHRQPTALAPWQSILLLLPIPPPNPPDFKMPLALVWRPWMLCPAERVSQCGASHQKPCMPPGLCSTSTASSPIQPRIPIPTSPSSLPGAEPLCSRQLLTPSCQLCLLPGFYLFFFFLFSFPPPEVLMDKLSNRICLLQDILRLIAEVRTQLERPQRVADWHPRSR